MPEYPAKQPSKMEPTHPGAILRLDVLPALNLTVSEAARQLGVSRQMLHSILAERSAVSPEMAVRLGRFCGNGELIANTDLEGNESSSSLARCRENQIDMDPGTREHIYQGIYTEEIDPSTHKIADPWLRDTKELGGVRLGKVAVIDELANRDHENRADSKVFGFGFTETEVGKYVAARRSYLRTHGTATSFDSID